MAEHDEQVAVFEWASYKANQDEDWKLLYAIPNGGDRHPAVAAKLKAEGVKKGAPDICWPVPRGVYAGFYGELKYGRNKATKDQEWFLSRLADKGYYTTVQTGAARMIAELERYAEGRAADREQATARRGEGA